MQVEQYAGVLSPSVTNELRRSDQLASAGYFTEAAIRLGRSIEAVLYEAARELQIDLTNRVIDEIETVQSELQSRQVTLLRKQSTDDVRALAYVSKRLAECISRLTEDESVRCGRLNDRPRPNEQLLRELVAKTDDERLKRRLKTVQEQLRRLGENRNRAAHASITGDLMEFSREEYESMEADALVFLDQMLDVLLGVRAAEYWGDKSKVPANIVEAKS